MAIKDLSVWKILDVEYDVHWVESDSELNPQTFQFSRTDFVNSQIIIYAGNRKVSSLWGSLWKETFRVLSQVMHIPSITNSDHKDVIFAQLATAFNCMLQDNTLELQLPSWRILDTVFIMKWCVDWDCINEDERLYGQNDDKKSIIHVYIKDRQDTEIWATLWHECLHTIINKMPIKPLKDLDGTEDQETIIDQIAIAFNQVMQCNIFPNLHHLSFK